MIVSHKHKFIFIKTRKTAGTSLEIGLCQFCGDRDIITRLGASEEQIKQESGYRVAQNYYIPYNRYKLKDWGRLVLRGKRAQYIQHMEAQEIRRVLGETIWNSYYKFCVERNPWDRIISYYYWRTRGKQNRPSLYEFIDDFKRDKRVSNAPLYSIKGQVVVDHIMRYENLEAELDQLVERLQLPNKIDLPQIKTDLRLDRRNYREVVSQAERELIESIYAQEILLFNYSF